MSDASVTQYRIYFALSRKRDAHAMGFAGCNAYILLILKNQQEAFSTKRQRSLALLVRTARQYGERL
jgi:hypothetical protein